MRQLPERWKGPTLRECWQDVGSRGDFGTAMRDFWTFCSLLVPRPLYIGFYRLQHPVDTWLGWQKDRWIKTLEVGSIVCDCRGMHAPITSMVGDAVVTEGGHSCSLWSCCGPVREDNTCHSGGSDGCA